MMKMNRCEAEIDQIRLKLYEETKHLTIEERVKRTNDKGRQLAAQYGFTIGTPERRIKTPVAEKMIGGA